MAFSLSPDQTMLKDSVAQFVTHHCSFEARDALLATPKRFSRDNWQRFADAGWLGVAISKAGGGQAGNAVDQLVICEGLGRAMVLEPYVTTAVLCAKALGFTQDEVLKQSLLGELAAGSSLFSMAFTEPDSRFSLDKIETSATRDGDAYLLNGQKIAVLDAPNADRLIVAARIGADDESGGIGLYLVDVKTSGLDMREYPTLGESTAADITFRNVRATALVHAPDGITALETAVDFATIASCAYATGSMEAAFEQTLEYVKNRKQFGVAIGSFQVIRHRMVDLMMAVKECQAMCLKSAGQIDNAAPKDRPRIASAAKAYVGKRARLVAQEIVQMHGSIGMTDELPIGHFFRSLSQFNTVYGTPVHHLKRFASA